METIKETKYLLFNVEKPIGRKTKIVHVINKNSQEEIATIEWYVKWRQYCFMPERFEFTTIWNNSCLTDVISVINQLMSEKRGKYNSKANGGQ
jgi:hypothetical protein